MTETFFYVVSLRIPPRFIIEEDHNLNRIISEYIAWEQHKSVYEKAYPKDVLYLQYDKTIASY